MCVGVSGDLSGGQLESAELPNHPGLRLGWRSMDAVPLECGWGAWGLGEAAASYRRISKGSSMR